jgi:hypothetical protein
MKSLRYIAASGALMIALTTAAPAFAESDKSRDGDNHRGLHLGQIMKLWHNDNRDGTKHEDKKDKQSATTTVSIGGTVTAISGATITISGAKGATYTVNAGGATFSDANGNAMTLGQIAVGHELKVHGTLAGSTITATKITDKTLNASAAISGTLASISGSTLTITGENGSVYVVTTAGATINGSTDVAAQLSKFQVGDKLSVRGTVNGSSVTAVKITNKSLLSREHLTAFNGVRAGEVTAVNGSVITINRFGTGTTTVNTSASTFFMADGSATSSNAISLGSKILVFGPTTTGVTDTIQASVVILIDHLKRLFH